MAWISMLREILAHCAKNGLALMRINLVDRPCEHKLVDVL